MSFVTFSLEKAFVASLPFQSLKGIHVVCDRQYSLRKAILAMFQSLKGIHVVCDTHEWSADVSKILVSIPERDSCRL